MDLDTLKKSDELVQEFLHDSQIFYDHALFAVNKKKERELVERVYDEIVKIDDVLGRFEVELN